MLTSPQMCAPAKASIFRIMSGMLLPFRRPHHVLRPRDRCRTITALLRFGILPEPVHAALSDAEISTITHFARVPRKELPQEARPDPVPECPTPAVADPHDARPHPGFARRQHSAHDENPLHFTRHHCIADSEHARDNSGMAFQNSFTEVRGSSYISIVGPSLTVMTTMFRKPAGPRQCCSSASSQSAAVNRRVSH